MKYDITDLTSSATKIFRLNNSRDRLIGLYWIDTNKAIVEYYESANNRIVNAVLDRAKKSINVIDNLVRSLDHLNFFLLSPNGSFMICYCKYKNRSYLQMYTIREKYRILCWEKPISIESKSWIAWRPNRETYMRLERFSYRNKYILREEDVFGRQINKWLVDFGRDDLLSTPNILWDGKVVTDNHLLNWDSETAPSGGIKLFLFNPGHSQISKKSIFIPTSKILHGKLHFNEKYIAINASDIKQNRNEILIVDYKNSIRTLGYTPNLGNERNLRIFGWIPNSMDICFSFDDKIFSVSVAQYNSNVIM